MKPYLIAEIGVNYYDTAKELSISPIDAAKLYIDKVAEAGIDCAKFQCYKANTLASKNSPSYWDTTKENTKSQYELFKKFDSFGENEYRELADYTHKKGIDFTSTPFDYESADYLESLVDFYKIASADLSNLPFIEYIGKKAKPVVLSVGASYLSEIDEAVNVLKKSGCNNITLLHCMLSYPTKAYDANLRVIKTLREHFKDMTIGYSDHVVPDEQMLTLSTAYLMGAEVIEKHFTLNKNLPGNDHYHAGEPEDFAKAIKNFNFINEILGSSEKTVFECEIISRKQARRSLVLTKKLKAGHTLTKDDLIAKRPGTGIEPKYIDEIIGKKIKYDLEEDTILTYEMVL